MGRDQGEHLSCGAPQGEGASHALPLRVARVLTFGSFGTSEYREYRLVPLSTMQYLEYLEWLRVRRSESRAEISVAVALQDCAIAKKFIEKFKHSKKVERTGPPIGRVAREL